MRINNYASMRWLRVMLGLVLTLSAAWHVYMAGSSSGQGLPILTALERDAYDWRLSITAPQEQDPRVIIVDVDEQSLQRIGQWPWPRTTLARLVERLFDRYQIDTLGFDMVFAEAESHYSQASIEQVLGQQLNQLGGSSFGAMDKAEFRAGLARVQGDALLATQLRDRRVVLGYFFGNSQADSVGVLPKPVLAAQVQQTQAPDVRRFSGNIVPLQKAAASAGFFSLANITDSDGIIRRVALLNQHEGQLYAALPLLVVQQFLGAELSPILASQTDHLAGEAGQSQVYPALEGLNVGLTDVPLDSQAAVYVPYRQAASGSLSGEAFESNYRYVSAWQVLQEAVPDPAVLKNTIVLFGTSAAGLNDLRNTPLMNSFAGVEIHATLISALLDGGFRSQPEWTRAVDLLQVLIIGLLLAWLLPRLTISRASLLALSLLSLVWLANALFWVKALWIVPVATVSALIVLLYVLNTVVGFFSEARSKQIMRRMFGLYVPAEIVDEMSATPDVFSLQSEKREMSVMFSDVRGFTSISEQLSPEALSELLNTLLTPITEIIHHNNGAVDKYMGDAVMAFWGAPRPTLSHAAEAVGAALQIAARLVEVNREFASKGWPKMQMGIGISTGPMSLGNMGSEFRMAYTVLGDVVNLGSRLEGLSKLYAVEIVVSEATKQAAPEYIYRELDLVRVKGKRLPERIFQPLVKQVDLTSDKQQELTAYAQALAAYQSMQWQVSMKGFADLQVQSPCALYKLYRQRSQQMLDKPPASDWDGVSNLSEK